MHSLLRSIVILISLASPALAGLVGDGKADDTAAVQKALDAGGSVRFARGTAGG